MPALDAIKYFGGVDIMEDCFRREKELLGDKLPTQADSIETMLRAYGNRAILNVRYPATVFTRLATPWTYLNRDQNPEQKGRWWL